MDFKSPPACQRAASNSDLSFTSLRPDRFLTTRRYPTVAYIRWASTINRKNRELMIYNDNFLNFAK